MDPDDASGLSVERKSIEVYQRCYFTRPYTGLQVLDANTYMGSLNFSCLVRQYRVEYLNSGVEPVVESHDAVVDSDGMPVALNLVEGAEVPIEFFCAASFRLMTDPVITIGSSGEVAAAMERPVLENYVKAKGAHPLTGAPMELTNIIMHRGLGATIKRWMSKNAGPPIFLHNTTCQQLLTAEQQQQGSAGAVAPIISSPGLPSPPGQEGWRPVGVVSNGPGNTVKVKQEVQEAGGAAEAGNFFSRSYNIYTEEETMAILNGYTKHGSNFDAILRENADVLRGRTKVAVVSKWNYMVKQAKRAFEEGPQEGELPADDIQYKIMNAIKKRR